MVSSDKRRNGGVESVKELKIEREMMRINERRNHCSLTICSLFLMGGSAPSCSLPSFWFGSVERVKMEERGFRKSRENNGGEETQTGGWVTNQAPR